MTQLDLEEADDGSVVAVWSGHRIGHARVEGTVARVAMLDEPPREACEQMLAWCEGRGATTLDARALVFRHVARRHGYTGALRAPLTQGSTQPGDLLVEVNALLPGVDVHAAPHGRVSGVVARLISGLSAVTRLRADGPTGLPSLTVGLPEREELNAEAIAMAIDMTFSVHKRFGAASAHVTTISFDHSSRGMASGKHAGEAARQLGVIHVNANYALARGRVLAPVAPPPPAPAPRPSTPSRKPAEVASPWSTIDATTAHELWHKIELAWETEHFAESVEFRRTLGGLFGKETLEKVFGDADALRALAREVSAYATTNRVEATAEMFKRWWCGPPPEGSVPAQFGVIVNRFFPTP